MKEPTRPVGGQGRPRQAHRLGNIVCDLLARLAQLAEASVLGTEG